MISPELGILNQLGTPMFNSDIFANRPNFGIEGRIFISTDTKEFYRDTGSAWELLAGPGTGTITGSGSATEIAFFNTSGSITSNNNLFWDNSNNRLGIGTSTPGTTLDIHGQNVILQLNGTSNSNTQLQYQSNGISKWVTGNVYSSGSNYFRIRDFVNSVDRLKIENSGLSTFEGNVTNVLNKTAVSNDGWYGIFSNDNISIPSGISFTGGNAFGSLNGANKMSFLGNATFGVANVTGGIISSNIFTFQNSGSVIQNTQPASGTRTIAAITAFNQVNSANNGTVNWLSGLQVLAPYTANSGTLYVGNYFGLLINASDERTAFNISNKWGVYQEGQNDLNYFRSKVLIGSNVDQLNGVLQVTGAATFSSSVTAGGNIQTDGAANKYVKSTGFISNQLGQLSDFGANDGGFYFVAGGGVQFVAGGANRMLLTSSGNLGIGVTPSAANLPTLEMQYGLFNGTSEVNISQNVVYNSGFKYGANGFATRYYQGNGNHQWFNASSGTAGNVVTFTQAMTLNASGRLGIGTASPDAPLQVAATGIGGYGTIGIRGTSAHIGFRTAADAFKGWIGYFDIATHGSDINLNIVTGYNVSSNIVFKTNGDTGEAMRITSSGRILMGTSTDNLTDLLQVAGSAIVNSITAKDISYFKKGSGSAQQQIRLQTATNTYATEWALGNAVNSTNFSLAYFNGTSWGADILTVTSGGAVEMTGTIKTAAPTGGTAQPWKLGTYVASTGTATGHIQIEVNGTTYKVLAYT